MEVVGARDPGATPFDSWAGDAQMVESNQVNNDFTFLQILATVATERLKVAKVDEAQHGPGGSPGQSNDASALSFSRISRMSLNTLMRLFSEPNYDEVRQVYSFRCRLMPSGQCSVVAQSSDNEASAKAKIKTHLQSHVRDILKRDDYLSFTARPVCDGDGGGGGGGGGGSSRRKDSRKRSDGIVVVKGTNDPEKTTSTWKDLTDADDAVNLWGDDHDLVKEGRLLEDQGAVDVVLLQVRLEHSYSSCSRGLLASLSPRAWKTEDSAADHEEKFDDDDDEGWPPGPLGSPRDPGSGGGSGVHTLSGYHLASSGAISGQDRPEQLGNLVPMVSGEVEVTSSLSTLGSQPKRRRKPNSKASSSTSSLSSSASASSSSPSSSSSTMSGKAVPTTSKFRKMNNNVKGSGGSGSSGGDEDMVVRALVEIKELQARGAATDNLTCRLCQPARKFTAYTTLLNHLRSHAQIRPYVCTVCHQDFTRQHSLNYHKLIHQNVTRFTCGQCGRKFRHPSHYKEHKRRHKVLDDEEGVGPAGAAAAAADDETMDGKDDENEENLDKAVVVDDDGGSMAPSRAHRARASHGDHLVVEIVVDHQENVQPGAGCSNERGVAAMNGHAGGEDRGPPHHEVAQPPPVAPLADVEDVVGAVDPLKQGLAGSPRVKDGDQQRRKRPMAASLTSTMKVVVPQSKLKQQQLIFKDVSNLGVVSPVTNGHQEQQQQPQVPAVHHRPAGAAAGGAGAGATAGASPARQAYWANLNGKQVLLIPKPTDKATTVVSGPDESSRGPVVTFHQVPVNAVSAPATTTTTTTVVLTTTTTPYRRSSAPVPTALRPLQMSGSPRSAAGTFRLKHSFATVAKSGNPSLGGLGAASATIGNASSSSLSPPPPLVQLEAQGQI